MAAETSAGGVAGRGGALPWRDRRLLLIVVVIALAGLLLLLFWGLRRGPSATVGGRVPLDRPAPAFSVTTIDGQPLSLDGLRGRTIVLNVWASWCVPCRAEARELNRTYAIYKDRNVAFIGIAWNDTDGEVRKFVQQYEVPYTIALDPEGRIAIDLGITGIPETFVIDPQGRLTQKWIGAITSAQLNAMLATVP